MRPLRVFSFGDHLVRYGPALKLMDSLAEHVKAGDDILLLLQHHPVYTLGKRGHDTDFKVPVKDLQQRGVEVFRAPRGGQVTYHGPGQLVAYPIVNIKRLGLGARAWVEGLEDSVIHTLGAYGIAAKGRVPGATGVWVQDRKIAALGVKISHGVSSHGLALNVTTDLSAYDLIVPCGIEDRSVTSLCQELQRSKVQLQRSKAQSQDGQHTQQTGVSDSQQRTAGSRQCTDTEASVGVQADQGRLPTVDCLREDPGTALHQVAQVYQETFCRQFGYEASRDVRHVTDCDSVLQAVC